MKPIKIIRKLNEDASLTDWKALKNGLSSCKSASDIEELMLSTMDSTDYGKYCDYHYEVDDEDRSSLQWAKKELRDLANKNIKSDNKEFRAKVEEIVKRVTASKGIKLKRIYGDIGEPGTYYIELEPDAGNLMYVWRETNDYDTAGISLNRYSFKGTNKEVLNSLEDILNKRLSLDPDTKQPVIDDKQ